MKLKRVIELNGRPKRLIGKDCHNHRYRCPTSGKVNYHKARIKGVARKLKLRYYKCEHCGTYHLTSKAYNPVASVG